MHNLPVGRTGQSNPNRRRWSLVAGGAVALLAIAGGVTAFTLSQGTGTPTANAPVAPEPKATPAPPPTRTPTPSPAPSATPEPVYDLAGLPIQDAFAIQPQLPLDDEPGGGFTGLVAAPKADAIPVFASADAAQPIAMLPRTNSYGDTAVPVVRFGDGLRAQVLLPGRQAAPSPGQIAGWVRLADVQLTQAAATVEVNLRDRTLDIVHADGSHERVASDFGWGAPETPTPLGRTFIMTTIPDAAPYVRGHLVVYTGQQSQTIAGFDGASVAVVAFHYYDDRSGPISNGCIRLDAAAIDRMAQLPAGTPVRVFQ